MSDPRVRPYLLRTAGEVEPALLERVLARAVREPMARRASVETVTVVERLIDLPDPFDLASTREALLFDAREAGVGLILLPAPQAALRPGLLVCDLDSTLVDGEGIDLLAAHAGRAEEVARLTEEAMRGDRDFAASLRERVRALAGVRREQVDATAASLRTNPGAVEGLQAARARGWTVAIASGGFVPLARAIAERVGATAVAANVLEERDGVLTGRIAGRIVDAEEKARFLRQCHRGSGVRSNEPTSVVAMGDGANDAAMLAAADLGLAYRPKPALLRVAHGISMHADLRVALVLAGVVGLPARPSATA